MYEFYFSGYLQNMKQSNDYVYGITIPEYNFAGVTGMCLTKHSCLYPLPLV